MRALEGGFAGHIASGATTLATCWRILRSDGAVLGFTDHDEGLSFDGTDFVPAHGLDGGELSAKLGGQTDTSEVVGVLHSDAIGEDDILLGLYDGAIVETWRVNWRDVAVRHQMRRDTMGEIVREDGVFRAELRSAQHALNVAKGRTYQALCDARLGDASCGVDIESPAFRAGAVVSTVPDKNRLVVTGLSAFAEGWFGFGTARWSSGRRAGKADQIVRHSRVGGLDILAFDTALGEWITPGDAFSAYAGCDRRFSTCRNKFGNGVNFRGFPHIPGNDFVMRYPRKGETLDGRPLLK
jgi:uncharacterized phage protein (TIGR02218 family)